MYNAAAAGDRPGPAQGLAQGLDQGPLSRAPARMVPFPYGTGEHGMPAHCQQHTIGPAMGMGRMVAPVPHPDPGDINMMPMANFVGDTAHSGHPQCALQALSSPRSSPPGGGGGAHFGAHNRQFVGVPGHIAVDTLNGQPVQPGVQQMHRVSARGTATRLFSRSVVCHCLFHGHGSEQLVNHRERRTTVNFWTRRSLGSLNTAVKITSAMGTIGWPWEGAQGEGVARGNIMHGFRPTVL